MTTGKSLDGKPNRPTSGSALAAAALLCGATALGATVKIPLADGWRFIKADDPSAGTNLTMQAMSSILDRADRGDTSGGPSFAWAAPGFDDSSWKRVRVPHDWGVETPFDSDRPYGDAFLDVTGVGWYRCELKVGDGCLEAGGRTAAVPEGGTVYFECDGAMSYSMFYLNGKFLGGWPYGYTRWRVDITKHLRRGAANTLAVRCHNIPHSSRWYTGGGLYRECRLLVCPEDHVVPGSVFITTPEVTARRARVRVRYEMSKSGKRDRSFYVDSPRLWDVDDPYLYTVDVEGDRYRYGIRTLAFHSDERRFQLNGRTVPLNGVSMHHDFGVLGAAWNRAAQKRRLLLFKEAGVNAIRSSHNPPDEGLLELCDELGLLVKDEVFDEWRKTGSAGKRRNGYTNLFDAWHERDLRAWVRTDRNHPCVIMYSVGNEICDLHPGPNADGSGTRLSRRLARLVAEEDPTRPATNANNAPANFTNDYPAVLAVMGCNYYPWLYPALAEKHPDVPFFGTETTCMSATRGEYRFPVESAWGDRMRPLPDFRNSSYCWDAVEWTRPDAGWACPADAQWYWMDKVKTCMGEFVWTGIDYLGGPYFCDEWRKNPNFTDPEKQSKALAEVKERGMTRAAIHTCNTGFLDQAGFRKDSFWLFQSRWRPDLPMAHILPHWNWKGREGEVTPVYVFTSGDEGELFLNGKSLGRQRKQPGVWDRAYRLRWDDVRYEPGTLEVVVYRNGREWARDTVKTTGVPARLAAHAETETVVSDGADVCYVNVCVQDAGGLVVPNAKTRVRFSVKGPGVIAATDNGDETDFDDFRSPERMSFNGWAQAIVRPRPGASGEIVVRVLSDGLAPAESRISVSPGIKPGTDTRPAASADGAGTPVQSCESRGRRGKESLPDRLRGPFPILSVPYHDDGSLDVETLVEEARFVAGCGVNGFIWAQSNDAIDLLGVDERKESFAALAAAFEGKDVVVALGCQGRDTADMEELSRHVESLAVRHPSANLVIVSRPPHDARTQDDIERYYRALARIARRPVIVQTYTSDKVPVPDSSLLVRLAREYPSVYGWIKEETGGSDANARIIAEMSAPEVKTVFSAWGSYGWLDQYRRFGTRGVISERAGYADVMMYIWRALEGGDRKKADDAFAQYLFAMNLKETIPGGHLRGFNLYVLRKRGIFKNFVSRDYVDEGKTPGRWKLDVRVFSPDEVAEIERRLERLEPFFGAVQKGSR